MFVSSSHIGKYFTRPVYITLTLAAVFACYVQHAQAARQPSAKRECAICHIMWLREFKRADVETLVPYDPRPVVDTGKTDVATTSRMCFSCHDGFVLDSRFLWKEGAHSHPVGKKPSEKIKIPLVEGKELFPLNDDGKVDCGTCHSAHGVDWSQSKSAVFMRMDNKDGQLCMACHEDKKTGPEKGSHPVLEELDDIPEVLVQIGARFGEGNTVLCESCHRPHGAATKEKILLMPNDQSQLCVTCHADRNTQNLKEATSKGTHPVNVSSDRVRIPGSFKKRGAKVGKNGEVICESCHRPHDAVPDTSLLVVAKREPPLCDSRSKTDNAKDIESGLCQTCHRRQARIAGTNHDLRLTAPDERNSKDQHLWQSGICGACHVAHKAEGPFLWARKMTSSTADTASATCLSCHNPDGPAEETIDIKQSHPVDVDFTLPVKRVPVGTMDAGNTQASAGRLQLLLPLYDKQGRHTQTNGRVACGSCHDPHTWIPDKDTDRVKDETKTNDEINAGIPLMVQENKDASCDDNGNIVKKRIEGDGRNSFLRFTAAPASRLCVECHQDQRRVISTNHDLGISAPKEKNQRGQTILKSGVCGQCHTPHKAKGPVLWARNTGPGKGAIEVLCKDCHRKGGNAKDKQTGDHSHPIGIEIGNNMTPGELPTFTADGMRKKGRGGMMDCATCHDPHGGKPSSTVSRKKPGAKGKQSYQFLRKANGPKSELCRNCHRRQAQVINSKHDLRLTAADERNIHDQTLKKSGICGACHVVHNAVGPFMWGRKSVPGTDVATATCMSCHDSHGPAKEKGIGKRSHPVDVDLERLAIRVAAGTWNSEKTRKKLVPLPLYDKQGRHAKTNDGHISCGTCHDPHTWSADGKHEPAKDITELEGGPDDSFLRIADKGKSTLCINCHLDKEAVSNTKHNLELFLSERKSPARKVAKKAKKKQDKVIAYPADIAPVGDQLSEFADDPVRRKKYIQGQARTDAGGVCATCHMPHKARGPVLWARDTGPGKTAIEILCRDCHQETGNANNKLTGIHDHPVGVKFTAAMKPRGLQTYSQEGEKNGRKGVVDCTTCHDPHRWGQDLLPTGKQLVEGDGRNSFLRLPAAPDSRLCLECHQDQGSVIATDHDLTITAPKTVNRHGQKISESGICGQCHTPHNGIAQYQWARFTDIESTNGAEQRCRSCHREGEIAANKLPRIAKHPEEVKVWSSSLVSSIQGRPLPKLPVYNKAGEQADVGAIACPSCHNPHQWSPARVAEGPGKNTEGDLQTSFLRTFNSKSFVCAGCHGLDSLFRYRYFHDDTSHKKSHLYQGVPTGTPPPRRR